MKRKILAIALSLALLSSLFVFAMPVSAQEDEHKVKNKWDFSGTFTALTAWGDLAPTDTTWTYKIHIKEAMDGEVSRGSIHFATGDIDVIGNVRATKTNYAYWCQLGK